MTTDDRLGRIEAHLEMLVKAVNGNGQPGLMQRVAALEMTIESRWAWILGASAALGALSGWLQPVIKAALK